MSKGQYFIERANSREWVVRFSRFGCNSEIVSWHRNRRDAMRALDRLQRVINQKTNGELEAKSLDILADSAAKYQAKIKDETRANARVAPYRGA